MVNVRFKERTIVYSLKTPVRYAFHWIHLKGFRDFAFSEKPPVKLTFLLLNEKKKAYKRNVISFIRYNIIY